MFGWMIDRWLAKLTKSVDHDSLPRQRFVVELRMEDVQGNDAGLVVPDFVDFLHFPLSWRQLKRKEWSKKGENKHRD